jgi:hypothetical protein
MQYADFMMFYLPTIFKYLVSVTNSLSPLPRKQTNFSHRHYIYLLQKYTEENYTILWRSVGPHHATFYNPKLSKCLSLQAQLLAYQQNYIIVGN